MLFSLKQEASASIGGGTFTNSTGQVVIPATMKEVYTIFSEGIAFVKNDKGKKSCY